MLCPRLCYVEERRALTRSSPMGIRLLTVHARLGVSYSQLAATIGTTEQHVINCEFHILVDSHTMSQIDMLVCTGTTRPTEAEFKALASALDIKDVRNVF